jgi:VWFA-related protein
MWRCVVLLAGATLPPAILAREQTPAPDEIRVSSQPYVPQSPYTIRVETKLVDLVVAVRDGHGRALPGLKRENFQIYDEGKERAISTFSEDSAASRGAAVPATTVASAVPPPGIAPVVAPVPAKPAEPAPARFLALWFDDVNAKDGMAAGDLGRAQAAAKRFVKDALQPGVRAGIFTLSGKQTLDFTADAAKLNETIGALSPHMRISERGLEMCPKITPFRAYKIAQFRDAETIQLVQIEASMGNCPAPRQLIEDQAVETWRRVREISLDTLASISRVVEYLGKMPGTRVLVMASSGFFGETLEAQQDTIINQAVHAGVVINALDAKGLYAEGMPGARPGDPQAYRGYGSAGTYHLMHETMQAGERLMVVNTAMADLAQGTGGVFFHNNNDLNAGFHQLGMPPEVTYRMSFSPEGVIADGSYHKLKVKLIHSGTYAVETRPGYFAPEETAAAETPQSKLDREVTASDTLSGIPSGLSIQIGKPAASQRTLSVIVHLDISTMGFSAQNDRKTQRITFVTALLDSQGKMVAAKEGRMDLALKQATYDQLARTGVNAKLSFEIAPGVYNLREVIEEAVGSNMASSTHSVDLR